MLFGGEGEGDREMLLNHMVNLPGQLLVKKTQTFQGHRDSQEVAKEEGLFFPIYVAL